MAFWDRKRRKKKQPETEWETTESAADSAAEENTQPDGNRQTKNVASDSEKMLQDMQPEEVRTITLADKKRYIRESCELIRDSEKQAQQRKEEYEQVTSTLTDIQKIDRIDGQDRQDMLDLCKKIHHLLQERNQYKNRELTITEAQMRRFDRYQAELVDEIKKMYQGEIYQKAIDSDRKHLEEEKQSLYKEQDEIVYKQDTLKKMAKILAVLIGSLILLFAVLYYTMKIDMTYPYLGTLFLATVSATAIFVEANRNRRDITLTERKLGKAIGLLNRVKIKYVNNIGVLDYNCQKFGVKNAADFEEKWGEYCKTKEYERKFKNNTLQLSQANEDLQSLLEEYQVQDPQMWLVQTAAILDQREMVEIRHELNTRRQKLREQIAYNTEVKKNLLQKMDLLLADTPQAREELLAVIEEYRK